MSIKLQPISSPQYKNVSRLQQLADQFDTAIGSQGFSDEVDVKYHERYPQMHYEVPNLTSVLYEYSNKEQDMVKLAFRAGNFNSLRNLPDEI